MRKRSLYFLLVLLGVAVAAEARQKSKVWLDNPRGFEKILRSGEIVSMEDLGSGRNKPKRVTLTDGDLTVRAIWKPIQRGRQEWGWESYQAEVAAYKLDRFLDLGMVPPTVVRDIHGQMGSLQLWVTGFKLYEDVQDDAPESAEWEEELSRMKLFDCLISNGDRGFRDFMVDGKWNIVLIDHSQAFLSTQELEEDPEKLPTRFDRELVEKIKEMESMSLQIRLDRLLLRPQVEAIEARRDALVEYLEKAVAEKGEDQVFH
jgi:hypothetical protein